MKNNHNFEKEERWLLTEKYAGVETQAFHEDVKRLHKGEPVAYIIGSIPFLGCTIDLSLKPLIPRTETEFWIERAIQHIQRTSPQKEDLFFLDIFSGSGCIGTALLKHFPLAHVDFGEYDQTLIQQIVTNIDRIDPEKKRARVFVSDCFRDIPKQKYHYIFANPPYLSHNRIEAVQPSVMEHEPHRALFAENEGLFFIQKLMSEGQEYLEENGVLFIEIDPHQKDPIWEYAQSLPCTISFWKDQFDNDRVAIVSYPKR